jgi:hypothetical protein
MRLSFHQRNPADPDLPRSSSDCAGDPPLSGPEALLPLSLATFRFIVAAVYGWWVLFRERASKPHGRPGFPGVKPSPLPA